MLQRWPAIKLGKGQMWNEDFENPVCCPLGLAVWDECNGPPEIGFWREADAMFGWRYVQGFWHGYDGVDTEPMLLADSHFRDGFYDGRAIAKASDLE